MRVVADIIMCKPEAGHVEVVAGFPTHSQGLLGAFHMFRTLVS